MRGKCQRQSTPKTAAVATGGDGQGLYNENYDYDSQGNLWKKGTVNQETVYTYLGSNHKHAVTHLGGAPMYGYYANGNMTTRTVGTTSDTQDFDADIRRSCKRWIFCMLRLAL